MPSILVHGGAGKPDPSRPDRELGRKEGLEGAVRAGSDALRKGGSVLDAVEEAVKVLEDEPLFNAGTGSTLTTEGEAEMDASVMAWDLRCGAVGNLRRVQHPVSVARSVMEKTDHVLLVGQGALRFARALGVPDFDPVTPERRQRWEEVCRNIRNGDPKAFEQHELRFWQKLSDLAGEYLPVAERGKRGTVGCVACDAKGRVAAATSTGGIWFKLPGRLGDTPIFGAGTYANGDGAASATGHGEGIIRVGLTKVAVDAMATMPAEKAVARAIEVARKAGVECGLIAVDRKGRLAEGKSADFMGTARAEW